VQDVAVVSSKCHRSKEKTTVTKAKSLFVGGLEIFPKKSSHGENAQTIYLYINKKPSKYMLLGFSSAVSPSIISLTIHDSTQPNRKTVIKIKVLSFL